jgi:hypothetical protein
MAQRERKRRLIGSPSPNTAAGRPRIAARRDAKLLRDTIVDTTA